MTFANSLDPDQACTKGLARAASIHFDIGHVQEGIFWKQSVEYKKSS